MTHERRKSPRRDTDRPAVVTTASGAVAGRCTNVSEAGALIEGAGHLALGQPVELEVGDGGPRGRGFVARLAPDRNGVGVQFLDEFGHEVLSVSIKDGDAVFKQAKSGGIVIETDRSADAQEHVLIELHFLNRPEPVILNGTITGKTATGIAVRFFHPEEVIRLIGTF